MGLVPGDHGTHTRHAFVGCHHFHVGWLAHHHRAGFRQFGIEKLDQRRHANAAHFFVVRERKMDRAFQIRFGHVGQGGQRDGHECLHVGGAAAIQLAVFFGHHKRIGMPVLIFHRHHVGVPG